MLSLVVCALGLSVGHSAASMFLALENTKESET